MEKNGLAAKPPDTQIATLQKAGQLQTIGKPQQLVVTSNQLLVNISIPRQGVSLLKLDW